MLAAGLHCHSQVRVQGTEKFAELLGAAPFAIELLIVSHHASLVYARRSVTPARIEANARLGDVDISEVDMAALDALEVLPGHGLGSHKGPVKTVSQQSAKCLRCNSSNVSHAASRLRQALSFRTLQKNSVLNAAA